jgi:hypothetical protein
MGAGIEPGIAAAELYDMKPLEFEVAPTSVISSSPRAGRSLPAMSTPRCHK